MFKREHIRQKSGNWRPTKLLAWAIGMGLLFGVIQFGEIAENWLRIGRNKINQKPVSGQVVFIGIDAKSQTDIGRWPWARSQYAALVEAVAARKPAVQVHDLVFANATNPSDDRRLAEAFTRSGNSWLAAQTTTGTGEGIARPNFPIAEVRGTSKITAIDAHYNFLNEVWALSYSRPYDSTRYPMIATVLAGHPSTQTGEFPINYSYDPKSVPFFSASDVMRGRVADADLEGKHVIIGVADDRLGDQYMLPGYGKFPGALVQVLGAETLMSGTPAHLGWWPAFLLAAIVVVAGVRFGRRARIAVLTGGAVLLLATPIFLERHNIFIDVTPGLFVVIWVACGLFLVSMKRRGLVNLVSGLPNLAALKRTQEDDDCPLIVGKIINFAEIVSMLPVEAERSLVDQIVKRLRVGGEQTAIYQSDEGIFAWTIPAGTAIGHHVEALHSLFRAPARVAGKSFDITLSFGVEIGSGRTMANRFASALVAAEEAANEGLKWKYHDPERLRDANWRLSLLSQLDQALSNGEVWVAYQPQMDLRTGEIRGAEALARWTHADKGPISPTEFIAAAEQHDRIEPLTFFVLEQAIETAARINREHGVFDIAVNLSARLLPDRNLPKRVKNLLQTHGLPAERLTLELTETAAMANGGADIDALNRLRDLGVRISIDDYGTGLSTLDYMKKIPASEIKIDQSFVKAMRDSRSDLLMVQSTITLAHSLGRVVVAEGVEDQDELELLRSMNCEFAQGYAVGRPSSAEGLTRRVVKPKRRQVA